MSEIYFNKLKENIKRTGRYPALIVRPMGDKFQIIDGYHRYQVLKELGIKLAKCEVWQIDDKEADLLLATLNRLKGSDDTEKRANLIHQMFGEFGNKSFAELIPESARAIDSLLSVLEEEEPIDLEDQLRVEQGLIEEKLLQVGVDADQASAMANLHQLPATKPVIKFVFDNEADYNKAREFYEGDHKGKGDPSKLLYVINLYENAEIRLAETKK